MNNKDFYHKLPNIVKSTLLVSEGWLIGSSIINTLEGKPVKDYDIIVPNRELFQLTLSQLRNQGAININSFGGVKFENDVAQIDIWPEELDHFLKHVNEVTYIFNYKKNILFKNEQ